MEEITVLGAGIAGLGFIQAMKERAKGYRIALIDKDSYYFDNRGFISNGDFKRGFDLAQWAQNENVGFYQGCVETVNLRRKKIYFKSGEQRDFQILVVATGLSSRRIDIKGDHREGFFYLSDIDPLKVKNLLKVSQEVLVYVSTFLGLKLAVMLNSLGKDVRIIGDSWDFLGQDKQRIVEFLGTKGIPVHLGSFIEEVIGEGVVKATKISPLKVFSSHLVFVDSGFAPSNDFFEEDVNMRDTFFTDHGGVYFLGDITYKDIENERFFVFNWQEAAEQAKLLADFLSEGKAPDFKRKIPTQDDRSNIIENFLQTSAAREDACHGPVAENG